MVSKSLICTLFFTLLAFCSWSQEQKADSLEVAVVKTDLKEKGIVVLDTLIAQKRNINPLAPAKAAFFSALVPGLGQIYNKKYWKAPIAWAAIGTGIYAYTFYDGEYDGVRIAFKRRQAGFIDDEFYDLGIDDQRLETLQENYQSSRDLALLYTIALYALNIIDANVDAHLKQFNIDGKLGMKLDVEPYLDFNQVTYNPNYGLALKINF